MNTRKKPSIWKYLFFLVSVFVLLFCCGKIHNKIINADCLPDISSCNQVVVETGDTLWTLTKEHCSEFDDIRTAIYQTTRINDLEDSMIYPGQILYLPIKDDDMV